jgi:hypothetical protein
MGWSGDPFALFAFKIDQETGVHAQDFRHGSSGGESFICASSKRAISSSLAGSEDSSNSSSRRPVFAVSGQTARRITWENDSRGCFRAPLIRE